ncbi:hypothetical protein RR46_08108 [Papilio xuthus]|uniref:Ig-like domain-containing protein n=1 Tax=Papilio xuthus TaxID=66420 RepID=A0A194QFT5_PAPXU|nr:hypothetical protein RR46_08108 [Papilio xuthus]
MIIVRSSKCTRDTGCVITQGRCGETGQPQLQRGAGDGGHRLVVPGRAAQNAPEILDVSSPKGDVGKQVNLSCSAAPETADIVWLYQGEPVKLGDRIKVNTEERQLQKKDLDGNPQKYKMSNFKSTLKNVILK